MAVRSARGSVRVPSLRAVVAAVLLAPAVCVATMDAAAALTAPAPLAPSARTAVAAETRTTQTTLRIRVDNCERCKITAWSLAGNREVRRTGTVANAVVTLTVPTAATRNMAFDVVHPDGYGVSNASPFVAIQYEGKRPGSTVSSASAANQRKGSMCWAGTTRTSVTIRVSVTLFPGRDLTGEPATFLRAWASPTLPSTGRYTRTVKGATAAQDYPCFAGPTHHGLLRH